MPAAAKMAEAADQTVAAERNVPVPERVADPSGA
jgi:hypothetical protein